MDLNYIFGRTSSAALACQIMNESVDFIVDESIHGDQFFYGTPVLDNIDKIAIGSLLVVPIYANGEALLSRIKSHRKDLRLELIKC